MDQLPRMQVETENEDAKHGFRFGSGLYFAEDLSKSLSYVARLWTGSQLSQY